MRWIFWHSKGIVSKHAVKANSQTFAHDAGLGHSITRSDVSNSMLSKTKAKTKITSSKARTKTRLSKPRARLHAVAIRLGELCVRPVETLLISRQVNAGKFCYCMTLLSYLLPVKWRKYQYAKLINEFLANFFYCTYPIENAVWLWMQLLQRQRLAYAT